VLTEANHLTTTMPDNNPNAQFVHRLSLVENDLLDPIADRSSLVDFNRKWGTLVDDLKSAIEADTIDSTTISMAHDIAQRVSNVVQTFLDLDILSEQLMSSLLLETSSIVDAPPSPSTSDPNPSLLVEAPLPNTHTRKSLPSYIESSYRWLLDNLHDPYPSTRLRNSIAKDTASVRKDIDGWFIDARKRMGWNALRRLHFNNKGADIVDAATQFFIGDGPRRATENPNINLEFVAIETRAKALYSDKFFQSDLAVKLDTVVADLTLSMKARAKDEQRRRKLLKKNDDQVIHPSSSYPSPKRSTGSSSPSPLPWVSDDDMETAPSQSISQSSRKRRAASTELDPECGNHSNKRNRFVGRYRSVFLIPDFLIYFRTEASSRNRDTEFVTGLPSPASSTHESLLTSDNAPTSVSTSSSATANISSRKRRLSDADGQNAPKRPRNHLAGPRLQAVSDPMPFSSALLTASEFDGWFHTHCENPNPDLSTPLEIELYDFAKPFQENQLTNMMQYRKICTTLSLAGY
jgi:hypothetical protein